MADNKITPAEKNSYRTAYVLAGIIILAVIAGFLYMNNYAGGSYYGNVAPSAGTPGENSSIPPYQEGTGDNGTTGNTPAPETAPATPGNAQ